MAECNTRQFHALQSFNISDSGEFHGVSSPLYQESRSSTQQDRWSETPRCLPLKGQQHFSFIRWGQWGQCGNIWWGRKEFILKGAAWARSLCLLTLFSLSTSPTDPNFHFNWIHKIVYSNNRRLSCNITCLNKILKIFNYKPYKHDIFYIFYLIRNICAYEQHLRNIWPYLSRLLLPYKNWNVS